MKGLSLLTAHISTIVIGIEATDMAEHASWDFLTIACSKVSIMHSYKALVSFFPGKIIRGRTALSGFSMFDKELTCFQVAHQDKYKGLWQTKEKRCTGLGDNKKTPYV